MNNEMNEKLQSLLSNEEYVKNLLSLGSAEAMSKELEKEGIDVSPEEIRKIGEILRKKENGELTDEELEDVAGGSLVASAIVVAIFGLGTAGLIGWAISSCVAC